MSKNMKYVMWGIKLKSLLSPIHLSYLQLFVALWAASINLQEAILETKMEGKYQRI